MADALDDLFGDAAVDAGDRDSPAPSDGAARDAEQQQQQSGNVQDDSGQAATEDAEENAGTMDDLFGDDEEIAAPAPQISQYMQQDGEDLSEEELARRRRMEYAEEDAVYGSQDPSQVPYWPTGRDLKEAGIMLVNHPLPRASDGKFWHVKLPNFLRIDHQPFDEVTFDEDEADKENTIGGKTIPDENVIRWRWAKDANGRPFKQSNARIIRWSDGSSALQVGAEMFDVTAHVDNAGALPSSASSSAQPITQSISTAVISGSGGQGLTYLVAQHMYAGLSETHARITGTMTFTPTNIASNTHRRLANAVVDRHARFNKTKEIAFVVDPEKEREEKERKRAEEAKKQGKVGRASRRRRGKSGRSMRLDGTDEEDDDEDDDQGDEGLGSQSQRYREEEEDDGFIVGSDDDNAEGGATSRRRNGDRTGADDLDAMEAAAERVASTKKKASKADAMDVDPPEEAAVAKRRLVIEDSD